MQAFPSGSRVACKFLRLAADTAAATAKCYPSKIVSLVDFRKKILRGRVRRYRTAFQELNYRTGYCTPEPCPDTTVRDGSRRKTSSVVTRPVLSISLRL